MTISLQRLNWRLALCTLLLAAGLWHVETHTEWYFGRDLSRQGCVPDPLAGYRYRPGPAVNEHGLVDAPVLPREPGELRIYFAGSSVTCAATIPRQDTFCHRLQDRLQERLGRPVRTINAGIEGYTLTHKRLLLEALAPGFQPDIVVLTLTLDSMPRTTYFIPPDPTDRWWLDLRTLADRSNIVQCAKLAARGAPGFGNWPPEVNLGQAWSMIALGLNFDSFYQFSHQKRVPILFVVFPYARAAESTWTGDLCRAYRDNTSLRGNPAIWVGETPEWQALGGQGFQPDGLHLNARAHEVVTRLMADELVRRRWATPEGPPAWVQTGTP